jgi:hypothetical protein
VLRSRALLPLLAALASLAPACRDAHPSASPVAASPPDGPNAPELLLRGRWVDSGWPGIRGVTVGPIENTRHPGVGYGSPASARTMDDAVRLGATWISLTPFGRVWDLHSSAIDLTFEAPFEENRRAVLGAIAQAHERGLRVFLVPHLWVETGGWRALIDPGSDAGWARWSASYRSFLLAWADVAREGGAEMLSVGVELRSWVTTARSSSMLAIIADVRKVYPGLLTYSANWDDAATTEIFDALDLVGINAFYPLAPRDGASLAELEEGGRRVATSVEALARAWERPVVLTEIGYTTRENPAVRPWEWPDGMTHVKIDERAQADAYEALIAPFLDRRFCAGFFVWRVYADPDDVSQEAEWGFSPRGKLAELVMRDAFTARWASDGPWEVGDALGRHRARSPGVLGWEMSPSPPGLP